MSPPPALHTEEFPVLQRGALWRKRLHRYTALAGERQPLVVEGILRRMVGLTMEAAGCEAAIGGRCEIVAPGGRRADAEVVGFDGQRLFLMPTGDMQGVTPNARVIPTQRISAAAVGDALLGRVVDGAGHALDERGPIECTSRVPLAGRGVNPLLRAPISEPLDVGIRSINSILSVGRGQRLGLFAGSGVGKSRLLGMMTRNTNADVTVVGLIGERGREVKEFVEANLGDEGMRKAVVVAAPADTSPLMRLHGAWLATAIAEFFRARGQQVLLLMDSLTRFAQAQREIALAIGEPPATKGYPPSVFARLPQLVERAGTGVVGGGSITAFYTVLAEGDDHNDPIVDAARAILDGHIILSRQLADSGVYPAVDIEGSISRAMPEITSGDHQALARRFRAVYSAYRSNEDLISVGAYRPGSDPRIDEALGMWPRMREFLRQEMHEAVDLDESLAALASLLSETAATTPDAPTP